MVKYWLVDEWWMVDEWHKIPVLAKVRNDKKADSYKIAAQLTNEVPSN